MKKSNKISDKLIDNIVQPIFPEFKTRDALQIIIGASILAVPVGFTEETWKLGSSLPFVNILGLLILSILFITLFTHYHYYRFSTKPHLKQLAKRVASTYIFSVITVALIMTLIQQAPWTSDFTLALKRIIIVVFPSSMSAAIADTLK
jgi:uncharacterized membrane protein